MCNHDAIFMDYDLLVAHLTPFDDCICVTKAMASRCVFFCVACYNNDTNMSFKDMGVIKGETGLRVAVGIDLGGTFIKGAIVDEQGHLLVKDEVATQSVRGSEWILQRIIQLTKDLIVKSGVDASFVTGLGIGIPGFIDSDLGVAIEVINIGWHDVAVVEPLQTALHMPVYMENDANLAALGESFAGAGRGSAVPFVLHLALVLVAVL